jgi:hypothetical protein
MAVRVRNATTNAVDNVPTHHISLTDVNGVEVGLILCNDKGEPSPVWNKTPIERTALKTSSGSSSYGDFDYPYAPITQDDWSGGRGGLDFERDSTKFYDDNRVNTHRENKAYLGPMEHFSKGYKVMDYRVQSRYICFDVYKTDLTVPIVNDILTFVPTSNYTMRRIWVMMRKPVSATCDMPTITLHDGTSVVASVTLPTTIRSASRETPAWYPLDMSVALVTTKTYTLQIDQYYSTPLDWSDEESFTFGYNDLTKGLTKGMYIIETAASDDEVIYYEYKGQQYKVLSPVGAAPTVWMNGDRGAADANTGALTTLIDATKSWGTNAWTGCVVKIVQGTGKTETIQYRTIASNTATTLTLSSAFTITHDTTTEYVIIAAETWRELTGHGLTVPVTAVLPVGEVVYFAQGDSVLMRSHREYNNAGAWTESDWRAEAAGGYATFLAYQPLGNKIWRGQNTDATGIVSVSSATPVTYATDLTWAAAIPVGDKYIFINNMEVYPADNGVEAVWVYKEHLPYIVTDTAEGIKLSEMRAVRSRGNGKTSLVHGVYSYFSLGNGLERYYGGNIEDLGPNLGEGLPADRQGPIISLLGYPGRIFAIVDGGTAGYSSLLERAGSGWHEVYRAPLGERLKGMALQVIAGSTIDRLWLYQGNISIWLPFASDAVNELTDSAYTYTHEGTVILSRMHAGMFDIQKLIRSIKLWSANLEQQPNGANDSLVQLDLEYRTDDNTTWNGVFTYSAGGATASPVTTVDLFTIGNVYRYGITCKRLQLRVRLLSNDNTKTPILLAVIVEAVNRVQVKYMYNLTCRLMDDEPTLVRGEMDDKSVIAAGKSALTKLTQIEAWSDASSTGLLRMRAISPLYDDKHIFINPPVTRQVAVDPDPNNPLKTTGNLFICSFSAQEA